MPRTNHPDKRNCLMVSPELIKAFDVLVTYTTLWPCNYAGKHQWPIQERSTCPIQAYSQVGPVPWRGVVQVVQGTAQVPNQATPQAHRIPSSDLLILSSSDRP